MIEPRWEVKIGSRMTTTDGDYGRLQQLLVDPGPERVVGLLVRPHGWLPYHPVIVPENVIAEATDSSVLLEVSGVEAALYHSFEPIDFVSPPAGWQPPYPYRWEQALFGGERLEKL